MGFVIGCDVGDGGGGGGVIVIGGGVNITIIIAGVAAGPGRFEGADWRGEVAGVAVGGGCGVGGVCWCWHCWAC